MTRRTRKLGVVVTIAAIVVAILLIVVGRGRIGVPLLIVAGIAMGISGPPADTDSFQVSDST